MLHAVERFIIVDEVVSLAGHVGVAGTCFSMTTAVVDQFLLAPPFSESSLLFAFPISLKDAPLREKEIQKICGFAGLYDWQLRNNTGPEFVLHDGPPYANGVPHVGHAINKILKDIINRYHVLRGDRVHYIPGWDCHGLPIELKALQGRGQLRLTPVQVREEAKKFAESSIQAQMKCFSRWGVMADWTAPYCTFHPEYEATQLEVFMQLLEKSYIYQDVMPVYWSPSSRTALAESELEYNSSHVSTSVYVRLLLRVKPAFINTDKRVFAVIWTTTPWTLPANQAVAYSENIRYMCMEEEDSSDMYLCEDSFVEKLQSILEKKLQNVGSFMGSDLRGVTYEHPLTNEELPFLAGGHVTANKGTGLVHTAPSHGHDDFQLAKSHQIDIEVFLDDNCCYTDNAGQDLVGKPVGKEVEDIVLEKLGDMLLHKEAFTHSYPYDWRTKKPVIIRTSRQWFIDTRALHQQASECLQDVTIFPSSLVSSKAAMLGSRSYWCISRQRVWGVPIPVFYHRQTKQALTSRPIIEHIKTLVAKEGSGIWWSLSDEELLPQSLLDQLGAGKTADYDRGQDILDIWFDSGSSWAAVLGAGKQADVYLEGTDQFGGWFLSSLLTSVALQGKAPYKSLVVHGFTMDEDGRKMSKSLGNVVDPDIVVHGTKQGKCSALIRIVLPPSLNIIKETLLVHGSKNQEKTPGYGADVLRWWAAVSNLQSHSSIGTTKLENIRAELYSCRTTLRFLLGNISCKNEGPLVHYDSLWPQDKYMLYQLYQLASKICGFYENFEYAKLLQHVLKFCNDDVSKFYASIVKDRCYCSEEDSVPRRASLTAQFHILDVLTRALAPILPHLTEDLYQHYPPGKRKADVDSLFKTGWFNLPSEWNNPEIVHTLRPVLDIREHLMDILGSEPSLEFDAMIFCSKLLHSKLQELQPQHTSSLSPLCEILQTASTTLTEEPLVVIPDDVQAINGICNVHMKDGFGSPEKYVIILKDTDRFLCERCRRFMADDSNEPCKRCMAVLASGWE
ncbi:hypothetical protein DPMN_093853 [Dreissena polymorpha]|uniref:isoleucine--tRNA ligase n=1 Tax=Dreissena polymorpha TaxID=45954 RepID=A0A9D4L4Z2_DREPO|nr:hypothetical protein DPMN_093853 [Dreissena polymorpha]